MISMPEDNENNKEEPKEGLEEVKEEVREPIEEPREFIDIPTDAQRKVTRLYAGLPVLTSTPTHKGWEGEMVWAFVSGSYYLYGYINSGWRQITSLTGLFTYAAGDIQILIEQTIDSSTSATYEKVKEIRIDMPGTLRVKFDIKPSTGTGYGRIYKNGVAVGTEQSSTDTSNWVTKSEDISGWSAGDLLQLYVKIASGTVYVRKLELLCDSYIDAMKKPIIATGALTAGYTIVACSEIETSTSSATYVKAKEIRITKGGTYRVSFDLRTSTAPNPAYGRIYKNGAALGTEQINTSETYATKSENLSFATEDLLQLYVKSGGEVGAFFDELKLGIKSLTDYSQIIEEEV